MNSFYDVRERTEQAMVRSDVHALDELIPIVASFDTAEASALFHVASGVATAIRGDMVEAISLFRIAIEKYEALGNTLEVAKLLSNIATAYLHLSEPQLSIELQHRALALLEELGDQLDVASALNNLGTAYRILADYPRSVEYHLKALEIARSHGSPRFAAIIQGGLATAYRLASNRAEAVRQYKESMAAFVESGDTYGELVSHSSLGVMFHGDGDIDQAEPHFRAALLLSKDIGAAVEIVRSLIFLASIATSRGDAASARALITEARNIEINDPAVSMTRDWVEADLLAFEGDLDAAVEIYTINLAKADAAGDRDARANNHVSLRDLALRRNDLASYVEHNNAWTAIIEEIRGKETAQRLTTLEMERKMESERKEREKERAVLYSTLPKDIADRVVRGEDVSGDHFDHAAVMFTDIVGFTSHTAGLRPDEVVALLGEMFHAYDAICEQHGAVKVKTIGDSYMCFVGAGDGGQNAHTMGTVALEIMNSTWSWPNGDPLQIRMGLHIGPVTAGIIGSQRLQYDVWGDTVNVASRMESTSEPGRIHISEAFAQFLTPIPSHLRERGASIPSTNKGDDVIPSRSPERSEGGARNEDDLAPGTWHLAPRGEIELKGKGTMTTYWLEGNS
jgi:adenylate cyclase